MGYGVICSVNGGCDGASVCGMTALLVVEVKGINTATRWPRVCKVTKAEQWGPAREDIVTAEIKIL